MGKVILLILAIGIFGLFGELKPLAPTIAQEQSQINDMHEMFEALNNRIKTELDFKITIKFAQPLVDDNELFWEIPYESQDGDLRRSLGDIGEDFVCFDERAGSSFGTRCTPFSNIVAVTYFNNP